MEAKEMQAGLGDEGGQALEEFQRRHDEMGGAIAVRSFQLQHDVARLGATETFVAQGGTGDVASEERRYPHWEGKRKKEEFA